MLLICLFPILSSLFALPLVAPFGYMPAQCPTSYMPDGSCAVLHLCIDPHERCLNGICCEPMELFPAMPFGYNFGMPLTAPHLGPIGQELIPPRACMDFEESCIHFVTHCNVPSLAEVCMRTCGLCGGFPGAGFIGTPYAPYGPPMGMGLGIWGPGK